MSVNKRLIRLLQVGQYCGKIFEGTVVEVFLLDFCLIFQRFITKIIVNKLNFITLRELKELKVVKRTKIIYWHVNKIIYRKNRKDFSLVNEKRVTIDFWLIFQRFITKIFVKKLNFITLWELKELKVA